MVTGLFYTVTRTEDHCFIEVWFDSLARSYLNKIRVSFGTSQSSCHSSWPTEWSVEAWSHRELTRLLGVANHFVTAGAGLNGQDKVSVNSLIDFLEAEGCQVVRDERTGGWVRAGELEPGDLWTIDTEALQWIQPCTPFSVVAEHKEQAEERIAIAIAKAQAWPLLADWLSALRPVVRDTSKKAPEVVTLDMVRELLEAKTRAG